MQTNMWTLSGTERTMKRRGERRRRNLRSGKVVLNYLVGRLELHRQGPLSRRRQVPLRGSGLRRQHDEYALRQRSCLTDWSTAVMPKRCRRAARALLVLAVAGLSLGACAGTMATRLLTPADRQLMDQTVQQSLETDKVGMSRNWANPESGHLGTVTPLRTIASNPEMPCRDYQQTVTIGGETRIASDRACRQRGA